MVGVSLFADEGMSRPAKRVRQYALTSANDFPQRDPKDWQLLGSNDGGKTWVSLDRRREEVFAERHQRRVFRITNDIGYAAYRLQVDCVKDPRVANSVQLAEIELMGESEADLEPTPIFTDRITARGDNPPSESALQAFDGRMETKWLDRPSDRARCASWIQWEYVAPERVRITNIFRLQSLRARAADHYRVELDSAAIVGQGGDGGLIVADNTGCLNIGYGFSPLKMLPGQRVRVIGRSDWLPGRVVLQDIQLVPQGTAPTQPERIQPEQLLGERELMRWVEVEGELRYRPWAENQASFEIQDAGTGMKVCWSGEDLPGKLPPSGTRIAVQGICQGAFTPKGSWVAGRVWVAGSNCWRLSQSLAEPASGAHSNGSGKQTTPDAFTPIEAIRRLNPQQLSARPHVKIRGVVTELVGAFIQDESAGIQVTFPANESRKLTEPGLFLEVEGWGGLGDGGNPILSADRITVMGRGKLPPAQRVSPSQLSGGVDAQWIELEGVVRATDGAHLLMICGGREITASVGDGAAAQVNRLVDAYVRVRGVAVTALDEQGKVQGTHLLIPALGHIEILEEPLAPASLPVQPIGKLLGMSGPRERFHRVRVRGTVSLQDRQRLFVSDESGSAMAVFKQEVVLDARFGRTRWLFWRLAAGASAGSHPPDEFKPGDRVEVIGFPETRGYSPLLTEVSVRKLGGQDRLTPNDITENRLADGRLDSSLVSFAGELRGQSALGEHLILTVNWKERMLQVLVPSNLTQVARIALGSQLQVTGVCQSDQAPYAELGYRVAAVRILTRAADDIVVLSRPPWWTVRRALGVIGIMAVLMLAASVWIKQLRRQVEERTAQLAEEIRRREQTERQRALEQERARIAKDLHDDLGANLTQIVFLSQRVESSRNEPQGAQRWLELIPATARRTIQSLDEIVWAINPRNDTLESLANYLSQFAQEHLNLAGIRCVLEVPMVLPAISMTAEFRHNLVMAAREALQNVVTHAGAISVQVSLRLTEETLEIEVLDNGRGFDPGNVTGEGDGLLNMRRRLEDLGGRLELCSAPGQGTRIRFIVLLRLLHGRVIGSTDTSAPK
jgi:signal transduction histidine kinase